MSEIMQRIKEEREENEPTPWKRTNETSTVCHTQVKIPGELKA